MNEASKRINQKLITKDDLVQNNEHQLQDIDSAVLKFFQDTIKLHVIENNQKIKVPILLSSPERWKSMQKDTKLKDNKKQEVLPVCLIKRNSIRLLPERYVLPHGQTMVTVLEGIPKENSNNNYSAKKDSSIDNKYLIQAEVPIL